MHHGFLSPTSALSILIRYWVSAIVPFDTFFRPFLPYSRQSACWTVLAVPNLLLLPLYLTYWIPTTNELLLLNMRFNNYLYHIWLHSLPKGSESLLHPLSGMLIKKFFHDNRRTDNILMFKFANCVGKCLGWRCWFAITDSYWLVTELSVFAGHRLYCQLTPVYLNLDLLTSYLMLLLILVASVFIAHLFMEVRGHISGGCIGSIAVDYLVSALLLWYSKWHNGQRFGLFAQFRSAFHLLSYFSSQDLLLWKRWVKWSWKEVWSADVYIVSFKSRRNQ